MSDVDGSELDQNKADRFVVRSFREVDVLVVKQKSEVSLKGKARVKCIRGKADINGYRIYPDGRYHSVFSPNSHSLLTLATSKSRITKKFLGSVLKEEIPSLRDDEISEIVNLAKDRSTVLAIERETSRVYDFVSGFDGFQHLFDDVSTKQQQQCDGAFLESSKLQIINDAPNKMVIPDYFAKIGTQFITDFGSNKATPVFVISGGKDSGKSTLCRYLVNKALNSCPTVAYLDCDLGQSEFTPSGCISLVLVSEPLLGPPFTHARQPLSSCYLGSTQPRSSCQNYVQCLKHVYSSYSALEEKPPLIVNTMGWVEGLGIYFLVETLLITRPTAVVQIESTHLKQNLPELLPTFVTEFTHGPEFLRQKDWDRKEKLSVELEYMLYNVKSVAPHLPGNTLSLVPASFRELMSLSYIGQSLGDVLTNELVSIHDVPMHKVSLKDVAVRIFGADIHRSHILCAINASIVALGCIPNDLFQKDDLPNFPKDLKKVPIECLGFGLVHHVNVEEEMIYMISPLSQSVLNNVNCLMLGCDGISKHLLLKFKSTNELPYIGYPMDCLGCSSIKPRGRFMHRKRKRSETRSSDCSRTPKSHRF